MQWWFIHHDIFPVHKLDIYPTISAKCLLDAHNMFLIHNGVTIFIERVDYIFESISMVKERTPIVNIRNDNSVTWLTRDVGNKGLYVFILFIHIVVMLLMFLLVLSNINCQWLSLLLQDRTISLTRGMQ